MSLMHDFRQIWAIMRRYGIILCRTPIKSIIRIILWPCFIIGCTVWILRNLPGDTQLKLNGPILFTPSIVMMTTIFNIYSFSGQLIRDKATNIKSLMISSGLKQSNYYCANSICLLLCILPISLAIAVVTKIYLFDDTVSWFTIITLLSLFAIHLDSSISFLVSFFTSPVYVFIIALLVFFENAIHLLAGFLINNLGEGMRPYILFIASFSPLESIRLFCNGYLSDHGIKSGDEDAENQPPLIGQNKYLIFIAQIFAIIFFRVFAYWFEEVCPWQVNSAPRNACFCLSKEDDRYRKKLIDESDQKDDPMFEKVATTEKEIGITLSKATKKFNSVAAVKDVTFTVYKGEATLLLGHNGAGKSTLMNMILGLLKPDSGKVRIRSTSARINSLGICPQNSVLDDCLNVRQHLELFNDIKSNVSGLERKLHIKQTIADVSLTEHSSKLPDELSGGMKRKLSLGMALVGKSEVLILDEPSSGLDPDSRNFIWNVIRRYRRGRTVLLSTQHMEEADYLGDRIAIMSAGHIVCCGSSIFLNKMFGSGYKLRVECMRSKRVQVLERIKSHFKELRLVEEDDVRTPAVPDDRDVQLDFVVELKSSGDEASAEMRLIELLEDLENNKDQIGVISYGLKSSSIEDVMLHTSEVFDKLRSANEHRLAIAPSTRSNLKTLTRTSSNFNRESKIGASLRVLHALCVKQVHNYRANPFTVLMLKLLMPVLGTFNAVNAARTPISMNSYWQNPVHVLMVGHFIIFPVRERLSKFKIIQLDTDLKSSLYWLSYLLADLLAALVCLVSINMFLLFWLDVDILVPRWQLHGVVSGATFLFCLASMMFCYVLSNIISDAKTAYGSVVIIFALSTIAYMMVYLLRLALFEAGKPWIQDLVGYIGMGLLPNDAYAQVYVGLYSQCYLRAGRNQTCVPADGYSPVSIGLFGLAAQVVVYGTLLCLIERQILKPDYYLRCENLLCCFYRRQKSTSGEPTPDEDVQRESAKAGGLIETPFAGSSCLVAAGLHKSYSRTIRVIRDLSFTVQRGECFGLLGVNGAGKSTTFSMLCGESLPDAGRILADGNYMDAGLDKYRAKFGYDPQSSPEMSLTTGQALRLMARLRGVRESQIQGQIQAALELLQMSEHEHKLDSELSGGTKRKLTLAMALIGSPRFLALDEPTAGVDPLARRGVWQLLKALRGQNEVSIIISSHAMEECEAICDRITIMARGRLRCIGTFLHLRSKFAKGCSLRVVFSASSRSRSDGRAGQDGRVVQDMRMEGRDGHSSGRLDGVSEAVVQELQQMLAASIGRNTFKLADRNNNSITFDILDNRVPRSVLFRTMREFRQKHPNSSYAINDSSLEDIFISLAQEEEGKS